MFNNINKSMYFPQAEERREHTGLALWISKKLKDELKKIDPVSAKLCLIEIEGENNITRAPTEEETEETNEEFYKTLEIVHINLSKNSNPDQGRRKQTYQ